MQIKLRKVLALLSCLAMLCTLLPMSAMSVFAISDDGFIKNGDFESSDLSAWKVGNGAISSNLPHGGTQSLYSADNATAYGYTANYYPTVAPNSQYTVTFWYSYVSSSAKTIRLYVHDGADNGTTNIKAANNGSQPVVYCNDASAVAGVWKQATITFNSGANTQLLLKFGGGSGGYNAVYLDDIVMTGPAAGSVKPDVPTDFGRITNGGFEEATGGMTLKYGSRTTDESYSGDYSLKSNSNTKYGVYAFTTFDCAANSDYTISFKIKLAGDATASSTNQRLYVKTADEATTLKQVNITDATTDWKTYSTTVNSGENTAIYFSFAQGIDNGGTCYIDDVIVTGPAPSTEPETPAPDGNDTPSFDGYIYNGDFETGTLDHWTVASGAKITYDSANVASGNFALQGTATAKYDGFVKQTVTVEANTDYTITFKAKLASSNGQPRLVVNGGGTRLNNDCYYFSGTTEWQTFQAYFNSGANTSVEIVPTQGVTGGGDVYYDDFVMKKVESGYQGLYPETMTAGADIRMMTYNVLVGQDTANGGYSWGGDITGRPEKACAMINYYKPDVIALEEFSGEWYDYFVANMTNYAFGEITSADSQNNGKLYTCLAYNTETIELVSTDLKRMTKSRWGTQGMRYLNIATFKVKATGEQFIACATHPDAGDLTGTQDLNGDGVAAEGDGYWRQAQLTEVAGWLTELSDTYQMPVLCGGDFNSSGAETTSYGKIVEAGFTDATAGRYIDHIFYNGMATHLYETTVNDAAVAGASDHGAVFADIQFLDESVTPIRNAMDSIKTQGRTYLKGNTLMLDYTASGIEFSANCEGDVKVTFQTTSVDTTATYGGVYFTVIVDGVKKERTFCHITSTGSLEFTIAEDLAAGNHTFEIYRQNEIKYGEIGISAIEVNGTLNAAPADNDLYIEFLGDSISCGYGNLSNDVNATNPGYPLWQDGTQAYPYLTAQILGDTYGMPTDWSDVAYSGIGCKYGYTGSLTMPVMYPYQRYSYDTTTQYDFAARTPDVVVIALGTNDIANQTDASLRKAGYQAMLDLVRAKNPTSKIVWIYGMMKSDDNAMIAALMEENGGAAEGLYSLELAKNGGGAGWHPTGAAHVDYAEDLAAFLVGTVLPRYVADEETDDYDVMDYVGSSRMEMTADMLGLAFGFTIHANGIEVVNGTEAVLDNATIDAFGDGEGYKLLRMGALVTNDPHYGLADMKLDDVNGNRVLDVNAHYLYNLDEESGDASFAVRITNIPLANEATIIYARAYYVFEYEGREIVVYDDIQFANYINKYDSNDGALEW